MSLQTLKEESDKEFDALNVYDSLNGRPEECHLFDNIDKQIKSFLHLQLEKAYTIGLRKGVEMVEERVEKERLTWASESIGEVAVKSVAMAINKIKEELK